MKLLFLLTFTMYIRRKCLITQGKKMSCCSLFGLALILKSNRKYAKISDDRNVPAVWQSCQNTEIPISLFCTAGWAPISIIMAHCRRSELSTQIWNIWKLCKANPRWLYRVFHLKRCETSRNSSKINRNSWHFNFENGKTQKPVRRILGIKTSIFWHSLHFSTFWYILPTVF